MAVATVGEDDNLATFGRIFFAHEVGGSDGETIDNDTIAWFKGALHTGTDNVVAAEDEGVQDDGADDNSGNEGDEAKRILEEGVFLEKGWSSSVHGV